MMKRSMSAACMQYVRAARACLVLFLLFQSVQIGTVSDSNVNCEQLTQQPEMLIRDQIILPDQLGSGILAGLN